MRHFTVFAGVGLLAASLHGESKIKMEQLPVAVQNAVKEQLKTATLVGLSKETEKGKTEYELESKVNGKTRDVLFDSTGKVLAVEEEVELASIPAAARAAIEKKAAGGTITRVESVTKDSGVTYEAAIKNKLGKTSEYTVNAAGAPSK